MLSSISLQSSRSWFGYSLSLTAVVCLMVQLLSETELGRGWAWGKALDRLQGETGQRQRQCCKQEGTGSLKPAEPFAWLADRGVTQHDGRGVLRSGENEAQG